MNTNANACTILLLVLNHFLFPFLDSKRAKVFAGFFEQGQPMWDAMSKCADIEMPTPSSILDLGSGPGEPACYFAQTFNVLQAHLQVCCCVEISNLLRHQSRRIRKAFVFPDSVVYCHYPV